MVDEVRLLVSASPPRVRAGGGVPMGSDVRSTDVRNDLADYLEDVCLVDPSDVEQAVEGLDIAERTWLEMEMDAARGQMFAADYDPAA